MARLIIMQTSESRSPSWPLYEHRQWTLSKLEPPRNLPEVNTAPTKIRSLTRDRAVTARHGKGRLLQDTRPSSRISVRAGKARPSAARHCRLAYDPADHPAIINVAQSSRDRKGVHARRPWPSSRSDEGTNVLTATPSHWWPSRCPQPPFLLVSTVAIRRL